MITTLLLILGFFVGGVVLGVKLAFDTLLDRADRATKNNPNLTAMELFKFILH